MDKFKTLMKELQDNGLPLILLQDLVTKKPSVTYTFFVVSGVMCLLSLVESVRFLAGFNFNEALEFFQASSMVYFGRSAVKAFSGDKKSEDNKQGE